jgi:hypothetical protein
LYDFFTAGRAVGRYEQKITVEEVEILMKIAKSLPGVF